MAENALRGKCECGFVFVVAHLPMPLNKAAILAKSARCPKCASSKIFVAGDADDVSPPPRADGGADIVMKHQNIAGT
ncbi:hypothetical protein EN781_00400 [Mesorhizobium sp. M4A.F.Ca.ET.090.04.2.1]|uniref:hypothetical protein n=1 Tax=Mesorhizobium sp. M4A.F.Ca.ET.090.04.2.1 TaxID=2496663 RepID=UPI000FCB3AE9|nr:hypothetical protein [Mesorhizobium sp. M4A.F.Ca.ET.090.04.2.1]RVC47629.1 hypothetical protein EN781_00400 [Mesorhizobium sp. M4A.F.Ca.ET.090.04.2.1]